MSHRQKAALRAREVYRSTCYNGTACGRKGGLVPKERHEAPQDVLISRLLHIWLLRFHANRCRVMVTQISNVQGLN